MEAIAVDRELIDEVCRYGDRTYDADWRLLRLPATGTSVHTDIRTGDTHPFRSSVWYAQALLEVGRADRAAEIIMTVVEAQDRDPGSPTFGVWPYFAEEPLPDMIRADLNWADFIGQELAIIMIRHRHLLPAEVRAAVSGALHRAAEAVIARNVHMGYTNIAAKGTFVLLAAGQVCADPEFSRRGSRRLGLLAEHIDRSGSFAEYNSPVYWLVTCQALTAIAQFITDAEVTVAVRELLDRLWRHLVQRWHAQTGQLSGPMSRAYRDNLADEPALLCFIGKAVGYRGLFRQLASLPLDPSRDRCALVSVAILDPSAPEAVVRELTGAATVGERREVFDVDHPNRVGTTWLGSTATLGTVNFADGWKQRRNLLGYWRASGESIWIDPVRMVRLRVVKDGTDFVSAVFTSVQAGPDVLWHVGFATPGGDRHVHKDEIPVGRPVAITALRVSFEFRPGDVDVMSGGRALSAGDEFALGECVVVRSGGTTVTIQPVAGGFNERVGTGKIRRRDDAVSVDFDLVDADEPIRTVLADLSRAFVAGALRIGGAGSDPPSAQAVEVDDTVRLTWDATLPMSLRGLCRPAARAVHAAVHDARIAGVSPPEPRLDTTATKEPDATPF